MDDLISREAAKAAIRNKFITIPMRCEVNEILNAIPAVDAAPVVHGRWIADSDGLPVCSVCDEVAMQKLYCDTLHETWRYDVRLVKTPYCPFCGAKMDGEANG